MCVCLCAVLQTFKGREAPSEHGGRDFPDPPVGEGREGEISESALDTPPPPNLCAPSQHHALYVCLFVVSQEQCAFTFVNLTERRSTGASGRRASASASASASSSDSAGSNEKLVPCFTSALHENRDVLQFYDFREEVRPHSHPTHSLPFLFLTRALSPARKRPVRCGLACHRKNLRRTFRM